MKEEDLIRAWNHVRLSEEKKSQLKDLLRHSSSYAIRQFGRTGKTEERIKVATWLQIYK